MSNGLFARVRRTASRNASMCRVSRSARLFSRLIVKKLGAAGDSVAAVVGHGVILARSGSGGIPLRGFRPTPFELDESEPRSYPS
jgi:hypothetical protein